jgi:hypothetical protein
LGAAVGRAALSAVAVTNRNLADELVAELGLVGDGRGRDAVEA